MITKKTVIGLIAILEDRRLQVRQDTVIEEDGKELSRVYHRVVLNPGEDVSGQPPLVRELAAFLWTPDVIAEWNATAKILQAEVLPPAPPVRLH